MITALDFPFREYCGRVFRAERIKNTITLTYSPKTENAESQELVISIKYMTELNEIVSTISKDINGSTDGN